MTQQGNNKLVKFFYFLSIIRWYNVLLIALGQYLLSLFVFLPLLNRSIWMLIKDFNLHLIVAASVFTVCGAFIINSFYDADKDLINRPKSMLVGRVLGQTFLANAYFGMNFIAILLAAMASKKILLFFLGYIFFCWFYSHKLQKIAIVREVTAGILTIAPLLAIWFHFGMWDIGLVFYLSALLVVLFTKDIVKEMFGHKGNVIFGYNTFVVLTGKSKVGLYLFFFNLLTSFGFIAAWFWFHQSIYWIMEVSALTMSATALVSIWGINSKEKNFKWMDLGLKGIITFHILGLLAKFVYYLLSSVSGIT